MDESIPIPFPSMIKKAKKTPEFDWNILHVFKKVEVTIPLLDAIQQIPKYAKFLKDLCTHKDRIGELETLSLGNSISSLIKPIPEKCSDLRPCLVSCRIGGVTFHDYMCDLGAWVSIMRFSIFARPFLKTSKFKLDAFTNTYSFEVGDKTIKFNLEEAMKHPPEEHFILRCNVIYEVVAEVQREDHDKLHYPIVKEKDDHEGEQEKVIENESHELGEKEPQLEAKSELKPLPSHLKYAFLGDNQKFPVIIASELSSQEKEKLLEVLRSHKKEIGWSLADIEGINPRTCMHHIFHQRRLNPTILDVVKKEVTRLLDAGITYPIFYSEWVSPVQVVPKKSGITTVKKEDGEVIHIAPEDQEKTIFTCPFGTFAYKRMPFRLCNAPATFQWCMTSVFSDLMETCLEVFMDDFRFYWCFIKNFSKIALPLSQLLQKDVDFEFDSARAEAFEELRRALTTAPIVRGPDWTQSFEIMCDALIHAVGAALAQCDGKLPYIIAYSSKTLDAAQSNYTITEKELLAIVHVLDRF
ncbi:uncharacterized protein LOC107465581 [Arachis duranensis]|uniref:Uncharacterized protein LOC107465581 n=1 Tax=Arachis duranensis TaxID=130453 RepID=A0A6P4BHQ7_ARADU|nr:uncharacterized protein LOC107465581 [Arachis duranensis]